MFCIPEALLGGLVGLYSAVGRGLEMPVTKENTMPLSPTLKMPDIDSTELWRLQSATPLSVTSHPLCWPCVASCCWCCGHVCSHSEWRRQCVNRPPPSTHPSLLSFGCLPRSPCVTASDHAWVRIRAEPHLVSVGRQGV